MKISLTKRQKFYLAIPAVGVILTLYYLFNPSETWWMPKCIFHFVTGFDCPGCGSQRALFSLLHGDFAAAFRYNAFIICLAPFLIMLCFAELYPQKWQWFHKLLAHPAVIIFFVAITLIWSVWRNLPHIMTYFQ